MSRGLIFSSVARLVTRDEGSEEVEPRPREKWRNGDFVVGRVVRGSTERLLELRNGRKVELTEGDRIVGALGRRAATLEATGSWEKVTSDLQMEVLTGGGVLGRVTSLSMLMDPFPSVDYEGHLLVNGEPTSMAGVVPPGPDPRPYRIPTILVAGTSMSAGKTTAARILIRRLVDQGLEVLGAKLTGAGHYRDILGMSDAGAATVLDFVDGGLPSTVVEPEEYGRALKRLLPRMAASKADVAVVEVGASPLEPYNGEAAVEAIRDQVRFVVLCATDPYAVLGIQKAYPLKVDLVTGVASNTTAGVELVHRLSGLPAMNLRDPETWPRAAALLAPRLGFESGLQGAMPPGGALEGG